MLPSDICISITLVFFIKTWCITRAYEFKSWFGVFQFTMYLAAFCKFWKLTSVLYPFSMELVYYSFSAIPVFRCFPFCVFLICSGTFSSQSNPASLYICPLFHQLYLRFSFILLLYGFLSTLKHFKLIFIRENIWIYFLCYIYRSFLFILANSNLACPFTFFFINYDSLRQIYLLLESFKVLSIDWVDMICRRKMTKPMKIICYF